ncbi:hypothetical protein MGG_14095, partial [Pyricularia oryzae 70-15]
MHPTAGSLPGALAALILALPATISAHVAATAPGPSVGANVPLPAAVPAASATAKIPLASGAPGAPGAPSPEAQFPNGQIPNAQMPGQFPTGQFPNAQFPNGQTPNGQFPNGQAPNGQFPNGQVPNGQGQPQQPPVNVNCAQGVHIIVARGGEERPGMGMIGKVADNVMAQIPGSSIEAVDYPASLSEYSRSQGVGVQVMSQMVANYVAACPSSRIVLLGYSQGAHVAADLVCGASEAQFATQGMPALPAELQRNIAAVVMMGDPSRSADAPFNQGNATKGG